MLDIDEGVAAAQKVASDPTQCKEPTAIANAWNRVKQVRSTDAQWASASAAVSRLEGCRKQAERDLSVGMQKIMVAQREAWAQKADTTFLDQGMNVTISLSGANKDRVTMKWALMSRAAAHKLTDGGSMASGSFLGGLQKIGFRRATFTDWFDDTWFYDLKPEDESKGGAMMLAQHGIGQPLKLTQ